MHEIEKRTGLTLGVGEATCGEGNGTPLQYSCLENPTDCAIHGVAKSRTRLSDFTFSFHFHALEKEMATHQCSCLENPRDRGAWWAAVYGVAQSQTRLKWLSSSSMALHKTPRAIWNIFLQCKQKSFNQCISGSFLREDKGSPFCILCILVLVNNEWTSIRH